MIPFDEPVQQSLARVAEAITTPLLAVDREGLIHVDNAAGRELVGLLPGAARLTPEGGPWQRRVLDLLGRLETEGSAAEVYADGPRQRVLEGHALSRQGAPWGGLVVIRPHTGQGAEPSAADEAAEFAHQVKNSLHALLLNLFIVRRWAATHGTADPQVLTRLEALSTEMHRLNALAETFLPTGAGLRGGEVIWLSRLLEEVLATVEDAATEAGVRLKRRVPATLPAVRGEARLLREALVGLLRERLQHLARGDETEIVAGAGEEYAFVLVRDSRASAGGAGGGPGRAVGLVDWAVRRHGGVVESFEVAGSGAALLLKLPIWTGRPESPRTEEPDLTPTPVRDR